MIFSDRADAGSQLAEKLAVELTDEHPVILALPRGGVPVAAEIARLLHVPIDVMVVRKIGAPGRPEFGIGAIAEGGVSVFDAETIQRLSVSPAVLNTITQEETQELRRRIRHYRGGKPFPRVKNRTVLLVDDGLATGVSALAAIKAVSRKHPKRIIFAAPVCVRETVEDLRGSLDDIVCIITPDDMQAVGQWYRNFEQVTDEEVVEILRKSPGKRIDADHPLLQNS